MKRWLISKIPMWILRYLVKKNYRLHQASHNPDEWYWADLELNCRGFQVIFGPEKPVGVPEWLAKKHVRSYKGRLIIDEEDKDD